jgi:hypothetical protein
MNKHLQDYLIGAHCGKLRKGIEPEEAIKTMEAVRETEEIEAPRYTESLDAMAGAEKTLTRDQRHEFTERLRLILDDLNRSDRLWNGATAFDYCHATAAQRAEAFLRTLGKWTDSP